MTLWLGLPESPRFLIAKDRHEEALAILAKYHANGDVDDLTVQFEYREIRETLKMEMIAKRTSSYLDFIRTNGNRHRLWIIISASVFGMWSGNAIISVYTSILYEDAGIKSSSARLGVRHEPLDLVFMWCSNIFNILAGRWSDRGIVHRCDFNGLAS